MTSPAAVTVKKRQRTSTPRVKTGCGTCRKRRVKCDETKPSCRKCIQSGWTCDFASSATPTASVSPSPSSVVEIVPREQPQLSISSYEIPFRIPGAQRDRQVLHYFCVQGALDISGCLSHDFWMRTVLQISHKESAVRQALVALSSLHLDFVTSDGEGEYAISEDILNQHGRALRTLQKRLETGDDETVRVALVCCVLFYCFESAVGNSEAAMQHLFQGLKVLSKQMSSGTQSADETSELITDIFVRLDLQATFFDDDRLPFLTLTSTEEQRVGITTDKFESLKGAQKALNKLENWLMRMIINNVQYKKTPIDGIPLALLQKKARLAAEYASWLQKFTIMTTKIDSSEARIRCGIQTLLIHHRVMNMLLASNFPNNDGVFGASPNPDAEDIIALAEQVMQFNKNINASATTARNPHRNFSSETGIIAPLGVLAIKCSDEVVRQKTKRLLAESHRREGLYDADTLANIVGQLTNLRNARLSEAQELGLVDPTLKSIEYWTTDVLEGLVPALDVEGRIVPKTVFH